METWFDIIGTGETDNSVNGSNEKATCIKAELESKPSLKRIVTTPLYLTFLLLSATIPHTHLPETRADLFARYFEALLLNWEKKHGPVDRRILRDFSEIAWIMHRAIFGDIRNEVNENFIEEAIEQSGTPKAHELVTFWANAGILDRLIREDQKILILPRHFSFIEYGFACKLVDLWDNKSKREQVWNSLKRNLYNNHLHEILLIFIDKIKDPEEFCSRVYRLQSDIFFSNLMLLGQLSSEIKRKVSKSRTIRALLSRFSKIWASCDPIGKAIEDEIVKYSYALGGIERLRLLLESKERTLALCKKTNGRNHF